LTARGYAVAAVVPVGVGEWKMAYSRYGTDAAGSPDTDKWSFGYVHNLSKRTSLYATAARVGNSGGARVALNGAVTQANDASHGYDLGIRHSF
jgi:predicted porin